MKKLTTTLASLSCLFGFANYAQAAEIVASANTNSITWPNEIDKGVVYRSSDSCAPGEIDRIVTVDSSCHGSGVQITKSHSIRIGEFCIDLSNESTIRDACLEAQAGLRSGGRAEYDVIYGGSDCDTSTLSIIVHISDTQEACSFQGSGIAKARSMKINGTCTNLEDDVTLFEACLEVISWH